MVKFRLTSQDLLQKLVLHHLEMSMDDNCRSFYELCEVQREPCVASRFDFDQRAAPMHLTIYCQEEYAVSLQRCLMMGTGLSLSCGSE